MRTVLRRLLPDSIAARTALTVVVALLLTQMVSALIYLTDRGDAPPPPHGPKVLIQRVTSIAQLVETVPAHDRKRVVGAIDDPVLRVEWRRDPPRFDHRHQGMGAEYLIRRLRGALDDPNRAVVVEMRSDRSFLDPQPGPLTAGPLTPPPPPRDEPRWSERFRLSVQLADGSWLLFTTGDPVEGAFRLVRFVLWMGGIAAVITLVSLWAGRRITAPLARFAGAAERLGVDGEAEPLPEVGPMELRAATRAFNRMQERLRRFVADRTQMVAAMSHDLRTPLTRLRLRAELVEDEEMQRKMLSDLDEMEAMVNATLAFARDDARHEPRGPLDLSALLQSLCDDREDAGQSAAFDGPSHVTVQGRPVALRRAFANLIDNAIAYGGAVRVHLGRADGAARVDIDDDGPGIPEAEFEKVFAPFYRLERSRRRDTGGVGLGLASARTILRGHGGDITLSNREEGGLRVTVVLPV